jgi:transcription initiation factor TFIIE subunit beta
VPNDVDLLKALSSGQSCFKRVTFYSRYNLDGLAATTAEVVIPKAPATKKKGKRGGAPRQRQVRITNTHLRGEIDLAGEFAANK